MVRLITDSSADLEPREYEKLNITCIPLKVMFGEQEYLENEDEIPEIPCDVQRMRQVFLNIFDNAAKHGGEGKRIDATMDYEDGCVVVRIRDYGPGIPEDELPLVKKKFYKGSSSIRGTGIGLAVCDEIVEMHGGSLILENAQGGGTLVTVRLPGAQ